jgi:hypothetical protein
MGCDAYSGRGTGGSGATLEQIKSILGHLTDDEAANYIQQARRKIMADGMRLWEVSKDGRQIGSGKPAL